MVVTFAQWLINSVLPPDIRCTKRVDKKELDNLLVQVARKHPDQYDSVVTKLKKLGDTFSTYNPLTMGLTEIMTPNKKNRDEIIKKYTKLVDNDLAKNDQQSLGEHLEHLQRDLSENDLNGSDDDASAMVRGSMMNKNLQLMKLRTSPGVVGDHNGDVVPVIFDKSYAEGVNPVQFFLGAAESRKNLADGAVQTAKPGELSKIFSSLLAPSVVSMNDCGTFQGLLFPTRDDSIINRYLARDTKQYKRNTLVTADVQQDLLRQGVLKVLVRSPQTCDAEGGSVCQKCMGIRNSTAKPYQIGDNPGMITSGSISEPIAQSTISSKHSTTMAGGEVLLKGEAGVRKIVEMPRQYVNRKILCEVVGVVERVRMAPQGGQIVEIRQTRKVPERYVIHGMTVENFKGWIQYHIPPNLKLAEGIEKGVEVWPGRELSTGDDNLQDVARLRNLGFTRSVAAENVYQVYKNTGQNLDRRNFELLARNAHPYVRIIKAPRQASFVPGEVVTYEQFKREVANLPQMIVPVSSALGKVLGKGYLDVTAGTEVDAQVQQYLKENEVTSVSVVNDVEVAPETMPMSRVVTKQDDWVSALNHRYIKQQIVDAASYGKKSDIHGFNPIAAYAFGTEFGTGMGGRY